MGLILTAISNCAPRSTKPVQSILPLLPLAKRLHGPPLPLQVPKEYLDKFAFTCSLTWNVTVAHEVGKLEPGKRCSIPIVGTELCGEALLDIEYAKAIAGAIPLTDVYADNYNLLKWATTVLDM